MKTNWSNNSCGSRRGGRRGAALGIILSLLQAFALPAYGQSAAGRLNGVVRDAEGNSVPGAVVTATNTETGRSRQAETAADGKFNFSYLEPAAYTVAVRVPFSTAVERRVEVSVGRERSIEFTLPVNLASLPDETLLTLTDKQTEQPPPGGRQARLQLRKAPAGQVSTESLGTNFSRREVERSPDSNRQLSRLTSQVAGAVDSGSDSIVDNCFNGRCGEQNVLLVDGVEVNSPVKLLTNDGDEGRVSPLMFRRAHANIQEFRVAPNTYRAEFGTGTGAQINAVTNVGKTTFQGTFYENFRNSALNARNFFDLQKPPYQQNVFGGRVGGPLFRRRKGENSFEAEHFFYVSYEGARARTGYQLFEAIPSAAARARATAAVRPLLDAFAGPGVEIVDGATTSEDFDIVRLNTKGISENNAFDLRLDSTLWKNEHKTKISLLKVRYSRDQPDSMTPEGVTGRRQIARDTTHNFLVGNVHIFSAKTLNDFRFYTNHFRNRLEGLAAPTGNFDLSRSAVTLTADAPYSGTPQLPVPLGVATLGGLLREHSTFGGRLYFFRPRTYAFVEQLTRTYSKHTFSLGGELRVNRTDVDRLNGLSYTFGSLEDMLQNRLQSASLTGDLGSPSPEPEHEAGLREVRQQYYIGYVQDEWRPRENLAFNLGLRYEYYTVARERECRSVMFNVENGTLLPRCTPFYRSPKTNFGPRLALAWAPTIRDSENNPYPYVLRAGFGIHTAPKSFLSQILPVENDRINVRSTGGSFPGSADELAQLFFDDATTDRRFRLTAFAPGYQVTDRVYKFDFALDRLFGEITDNQVKFTAAYVGTRGQDLLVRGFANRIESITTNADPTRPAVVVREFDDPQADPVRRPFDEIETRGSNGWNSYHALQLSLDGKWISRNVQSLKAQYTLSRNFGNTNGGDKASAASNPFDLDAELGHNAEDVRHVFSLGAEYILPVGRGQKLLRGASGLSQQLFGGWSVATLINVRTGKPIDVRIDRPDVVYLDADGLVHGSPAAGRVALINTPGGGATAGLRRPDLVPGVSPYLGRDRAYLNPAAFAIPAPGTFGNLKRGALRGPGLKQVDLSLGKEFALGTNESPHRLELRMEVFNVFNFTNFRNPLARLSNALGIEETQLQPGQSFAGTAAGNFGLLNATDRYKDLGASRQFQFKLIIKLNKGIDANPN